MPEARERRSQQERRADTERRVLAAATALIARNGSRSMSLAAVGDEAGYSRGIVNHQFGSKSRLIAAVVKAAQQFDVPEADGGGLHQLGALVSAYLANLREDTPAARAFLVLWAEAMVPDPVLTPLFDERDAWFRAQLAGMITAGIEDGSVRADADPEQLAVALLGLLRGTAMQLLLTAGPVDVPSITEQLTTFVRRGLGR